MPHQPIKVNKAGKIVTAILLKRPSEAIQEDIHADFLSKNLRWIIYLRFGVLFSILLFALGIRSLFPQLSIPPSTLFLAAFFLGVVNIGYTLHYNKIIIDEDVGCFLRKATFQIQIQMWLDYLVLGFMSYCSGGLETPLIYFFLIHCIIACLFFPRRISVVYTIISVLIITFNTFGLYFNYLPARHVLKNYDFSFFYEHPQFYFSYFGLVIFLYFTIWYLISSITKELGFLENSLKKQVKDLLEMDREKTRHMLTTTHELKAPFAAIESYINMILEGFAGPVEKKVENILIKVKARCERLTSMIIEMLRLADLKSTRQKAIQMEAVPIFELVESVAHTFEQKAKEKGIVVNLPEDVSKDCAVWANKELLEILMGNLIANALNYSLQETAISLFITEEEKSVNLEVKDQGIGIKKEHLDKIFLEYFRSDEAAKINKNSSGLGLAIVKQIIQIHQGEIRVESIEGKGTSFIFSLPKSDF